MVGAEAMPDTFFIPWKQAIADALQYVEHLTLFHDMPDRIIAATCLDGLGLPLVTRDRRL